MRAAESTGFRTLPPGEGPETRLFSRASLHRAREAFQRVAPPNRRRSERSASVSAGVQRLRKRSNGRSARRYPAAATTAAPNTVERPMEERSQLIPKNLQLCQRSAARFPVPRKRNVRMMPRLGRRQRCRHRSASCRRWSGVGDHVDSPGVGCRPWHTERRAQEGITLRQSAAC
jgi:hypothetical protein